MALRRIEAVLAATKNAACLTSVITLAVFFDAMSFLTLTTLLYLLNRHAETKALMFFFVLGFLVIFESLRIPGQGRNYSFLMLLYILISISTVIALAILVAVELSLKALAVQFNALGSFAAASELLLLSLHHDLLLPVLSWQNLLGTSALTFLGKRRRRVPYSIFD